MMIPEQVPITGTNYCVSVFHRWIGSSSRQLTLQRDPDNPHDKRAVKVLFEGKQLGWVGRTHNEAIAQALDAGHAVTIEKTKYYPERDHMDCLWAWLKLQPKAAVDIPYTGQIGAVSNPPKPLLSWDIGTVFRLSSGPSRATVDLLVDGARCGYIYKKDLPEGLDWVLYEAVRVTKTRESNAYLALRWRSKAGPGSNDYMAQLQADVDWTNAQDAESYLHGSFNRQPDELKYNTDPHAHKSRIVSPTGRPEPKPQIQSLPLTPKTEKENTVNKISLKQVIANNKTAATSAGYLEAGRIANNQFAKLASRKLPMMVRGYADTALGKVVIANIAMSAAQYFRPDDARLAQLTSAMATQAIQEAIQQIDIEGFLDDLLDSPEIKRAFKKLPAGSVGTANEVGEEDGEDDSK